jgi:hypothetical protein
MFEFLKTKFFRLFFSFMCGVFIILMLNNKEVPIVHTNANIQEVESSTYQIGSKCYKFKSVAINC